MIVLWTLFVTFLVPQPLTAADSKYYADLCVRSGGAEVHIGGNFRASPKEAHTARLVECMGGAPKETEPAPEFKPNA